MASHKEYRLADTSWKDVDLRKYQKEIISAIEEAVPGKHPKVYKDYFTTDKLKHSEAVRIGRALSKQDDLIQYGKFVKTFRLFRGITVEDEAPSGGRMK